MKRSKQFERTTRDIVNAFMEVLGRKPFEKIVVQDVLDAAMINRSTFYQHFADKYAILSHLQEKYVTGFSEIITPLREQDGRRFSEMDAVVSEYMAKNRDALCLLLPIKTDHIDFRQGFQDVWQAYFHRIIPSLSPLELTMLSDVIMDYFIYSLTHNDISSKYASGFFECCLNLTLAFFTLESYPQARSELLDLIGRYRST